jgi:hypothetical protein
MFYRNATIDAILFHFIPLYSILFQGEPSKATETPQFLTPNVVINQIKMQQADQQASLKRYVFPIG